MSTNIIYEFEERSGIREYDGCTNREISEDLAYKELLRQPDLPKEDLIALVAYFQLLRNWKIEMQNNVVEKDAHLDVSNQS